MNSRQREVLQAQLDEEKKILQELKKVYGQALIDCEKKIMKLTVRKDLENLQSIVYQKQYQNAIRQQLEGVLKALQSNSYEKVSEYLSECYQNGYIGVAYDLHGQKIPLMAAIDQRAVLRAVQTDSKISKGLYDRLGEDVQKLKTSISAEVSRSIAAGLTWAEAARNLTKAFKATEFSKAYNNAMRIVRTEGHRIQVQSAMDAQQYAKEKGADIVKQWDATLDGRTRPAHAEADGQIRELDEDFDVGGEKMPAPGVGGSAANVCNCRCALLQRARWALGEEELDVLKKRAEFFGLDKTTNFYEFKEKYLKLPEDASTMKSDKVFYNGEGANNYFYKQQMYQTWKKNLDDIQKQAIKNYSGTDYQLINHRLRAGNNDEDILREKRIYGRDKTGEQIKHLDKVISSFELMDDITVYRNVDAEMFAEYFDDTQRLLGKEITEKGYSSTSAIELGAMSDKDCKIEIHIPAGKGMGAYINEFSEYKDKEYEFLIARNSTFRVLKVTETENDLLLEMEMVKK